MRSGRELHDVLVLGRDVGGSDLGVPDGGGGVDVRD